MFSVTGLCLKPDYSCRLYLDVRGSNVTYRKLELAPNYDGNRVNHCNYMCVHESNAGIAQSV